MPFVYRRVIRFHETDAAGVVYFASLLSLCHEAYEAAIAAKSSLNPKQFFSGAATTAVPIVHTAADFYQPLFCGDAIAIALTPKQRSPHSFEITYSITASIEPQTHIRSNRPESNKSESNKPTKNAQPNAPKPSILVSALTRHVCINTKTRRRVELPTELISWIANLAEPESARSAPGG